MRLLGQLAIKRCGWIAAGVALALLSLAAAVALLALSGWFITASALAGLGLIVALEIFAPGAAIRLAAVTRTVARYGERLVSHEVTFRLLTDLRVKVFGRLLQQDEMQLKSLRRGDTLSRLTGDIDTLDHIFTGIAAPSVAALLLGLLASALLALLDPIMALVTLGCLVIGGPLVSGLAHQAGNLPGQRLGQALPDLRGLVSDGLEGQHELRALNRLDDYGLHLRNASIGVARLQQQLATFDALGQAAVTALGLLATWLTLLIALMLYSGGQLSAPLAGLAVLAVYGLSEAWQPLPGAWRRLGQCRTAIGRTAEVLDQSSRLPVPVRPVTPSGRSFQVERVSFNYPGNVEPVLHEFSLTIQAGERVAMSGRSGAGKSTLALLLMRQIDPASGRILLGGMELTRMDPRALRHHIGWLPQRSVLFRDTLAANLRLARPDASDADLMAALAAVDLSSLVEDGPAGLDSWIDEAGANLSGGQRRRVALARLMLTDPPMVILDEPMSGVDAETARGLCVALDQWLDGRTVVLIGHDPTLLPRHDCRIHLQ